MPRDHPAPNDSPAWAVFDRTGAPRALLDLITSRWGLLVLMGLHDGTRRFGELHSLVEGCSEKMLAKSLRELELAALVTRTPHATAPPRVDYALTDEGRAAAAIGMQLAEWAQENARLVQLGDAPSA